MTTVADEPEDYPDDITRLVDAYRAHYGVDLSRAEAQRAWWRHSDTYAASWLTPNGTSAEWLARILHHQRDAVFYGAEEE